MYSEARNILLLHIDSGTKNTFGIFNVLACFIFASIGEKLKKNIRE